MSQCYRRDLVTTTEPRRSLRVLTAFRQPNTNQSVEATAS